VNIVLELESRVEREGERREERGWEVGAGSDMDAVVKVRCLEEEEEEGWLDSYVRNLCSKSGLRKRG
jgi:hypothetical protein